MAETVGTNQFKNGMHIEIEGGVWRIVDFQHVKPGKGGAFVRTKVKNIDTGAVVDKTFRAGEKFQRMHTEVKSAQYLYDSGDDVVFMEDDTYEQFSLPRTSLADELAFIPPSTQVQVLTVDGKPSGLQLPSSIELTVAETEPGVETLSEREFQIFCKLAEGKSVSEIAAKLFLSVKTVSTYRTRILEKMSMKTNADITYYAIKNNLLQ